MKRHLFLFSIFPLLCLQACLQTSDSNGKAENTCLSVDEAKSIFKSALSTQFTNDNTDTLFFDHTSIVPDWRHPIIKTSIVDGSRILSMNLLFNSDYIIRL